MGSQSHRRRRRPGDQNPLLGVDLLATIIALASIPTLRELNLMRMESCFILWRTPTACIGVCPGLDDFLVWMQPAAQSGIAVPMTHEVIDDFTSNVLPALLEYERASVEAVVESRAEETEYALGVARKVIDGLIDPETPIPEFTCGELPSTPAADTAHAKVVEALNGFIGRHESKTDLL